VASKTQSTYPRRSRRTEQTRSRIVAAAGCLFVDRGYLPTTIEAVAQAADVSVETVYVRFRNKRNLLDAYLDAAIVGDADPVPLFDRPAVRAVAAESDQHRQVQLLAAVIAGVLVRTAPVQRVIAGAVAVAPDLDEVLAEDDRRRRETHGAFVDLLRASGGLRKGLTRTDAIDTLSAFANPETHRFLTVRRGFSAWRYERWLARSMDRLLLPGD